MKVPATARVLGAIAGAMILLSAPAHSLMGWPQLSAQLIAAGVGVDLLFGLQVGWHFGGVAMIVMGLTVLHACLRNRGTGLRSLPVIAVAAAYLAFGGWAYLASGDPFFAVFLVPGALLGAAWLHARERGSPALSIG